MAGVQSEKGSFNSDAMDKEGSEMVRMPLILLSYEVILMPIVTK